MDALPSRNGRLLDDERRVRAGCRRAPRRRAAASSRARSCGRTEIRRAPGPAKSRRQRARSTSRAVSAPPGSSQPRISPKTSAARARQHAAQPQLRQHAIDPVRPLVDVLEEQDAAVRRVERERRPERRDQLRHRAAEQRPCRLAGPQRLAGRRARSSSPRPSLQQRQERALVVARRRRAPAGRSSIGPWSAVMPHCARQPRQQRRVVAVADEQLRRALRASPRSSSGSSWTLP